MIKALRQGRGWTMRELAERLDTTSSTVNKLEKGVTRLNVEWIKRLSEAFDVLPEAIVEFSLTSPPLYSGDAEVYDELPEELKLKETQTPYIVTSDVLDQIGIYPGMILIVDDSPRRVKNVSSGDIVIAKRNDSPRAPAMLRQFIAPKQLITNSSEHTGHVINLSHDDVAITGVVIAAHRRFESKFGPDSDFAPMLRDRSRLK